MNRHLVPPPAPAAPFQLPRVDSFRLANGVTVAAVKVPGSPIVHTRILARAGGHRNPDSRPGLANLVGVLLHQGTATAAGIELVRRIERFGGSIESGASWDCGFAETRLLSRHLEAGLEQLAEAIVAPAFHGPDVSRVAAAHRHEVTRRLSSPLAWLEDIFSLLVYPGSPYAFPLAGTPQGLQLATREEVAEFHRRYYLPADTFVLVVGDVDPDWLQRRTEASLAWPAWPATTSPEPLADIAPSWPEQPRIVVVDWPGAAQCQLLVGHAGIPGNHPDALLLNVANTVLGRPFLGRFEARLREAQGITYGVQSQLAERLGPGPFTVTAAVETGAAGLALGEILATLEGLVEEEVNAQELRETIDFMNGCRALAFQGLGQIANRCQRRLLQDQPLDFEAGFIQLEETTPGSLLEAARRHLRPGAATIVAAGPGELLKRQLEAFGPVHVHRLG